MKVLFVFHQAGRGADGGVRSLSLITDNAVSNGLIEAAYVANAAHPKVAPEDIIPFQQLRRDPPALHLRMLAALARHRPDVIHANDSRAFWAAAPAATLAGIPIVLNVRDIKPPHMPYSPLWRLAMHRATEVITLSEHMSEQFRARVRPYWGDPPRLSAGGSVVPLPSLFDRQRARHAIRQRLGISEDTTIMLRAAGIRPSKLQAEHLEAWSDLPPHVHLVFAGDVQDPSYGDRFRRAVQDSPFRQRIHVLDFVENVDELYRGADLTLVTSNQEGMARCMLESLAQETPVVSHDISSAREVLEADALPARGVVVDNMDPARFLSRSLELLGQPDTRAAMGNAGRRYIAERCSAETVVARYVACYRRAIGADHAPKVPVAPTGQPW